MARSWRLLSFLSESVFLGRRTLEKHPWKPLLFLAPRHHSYLPHQEWLPLGFGPAAGTPERLRQNLKGKCATSARRASSQGALVCLVVVLGGGFLHVLSPVGRAAFLTFPQLDLVHIPFLLLKGVWVAA